MQRTIIHNSRGSPIEIQMPDDWTIEHIGKAYQYFHLPYGFKQSQMSRYAIRKAFKDKIKDDFDQFTPCPEPANAYYVHTPNRILVLHVRRDKTVLMFGTQLLAISARRSCGFEIDLWYPIDRQPRAQLDSTTEPTTNVKCRDVWTSTIKVRS